MRMRCIHPNINVSRLDIKMEKHDIAKVENPIALIIKKIYLLFPFVQGKNKISEKSCTIIKLQ
jgi:hypothetical protein